MGLTSQLEVAGSLTALCHRPTEAQDLARVAAVSSWSRGTTRPRMRNPPLWAPGTVSPFGPSHPDSTLQVQLLEAGRPAGPTQRVRQDPGEGGPALQGQAQPHWPQAGLSPVLPKEAQGWGQISWRWGGGRFRSPWEPPLQPGPLPPTPGGNSFQMWLGEDRGSLHPAEEAGKGLR